MRPSEEYRLISKDQFEGMVERGINNFTGYYMKGETFQNCNLSKANLKGITFIQCKFENFTAIHMEQVEFQRCWIKNAKLQNAQLRGATFWQCMVMASSFQNADISSAKLERTSFEAVNLSNVSLTSTYIERCAFAEISASEPIRGKETLQLGGQDDSEKCLLLLSLVNTGKKRMTEPNSYRYYLTQRPAGPGAFPKDNVIECVNFKEKKQVDVIERAAWGYVDYSLPLTKEQIRDYELTFAPYQYDVKKEIERAGYSVTEARVKAINELNQAFQRTFAVSEIKELYWLRRQFSEANTMLLTSTEKEFDIDHHLKEEITRKDIDRLRMEADKFEKQMDNEKFKSDLQKKVFNAIAAMRDLANIWEENLVNHQFIPKELTREEKRLLTGIGLDGHFGTWHPIDCVEAYGNIYYLMEHDEHDKFGEEILDVIINQYRHVVLEDIYNGFTDLKEFFADYKVESEIVKSGYPPRSYLINALQSVNETYQKELTVKDLREQYRLQKADPDRFSNEQLQAVRVAIMLFKSEELVLTKNQFKVRAYQDVNALEV